MPTLVVTDANILIDLALTEHHELLFLPDWSAATTYEVFYELRLSEQASWQPFIDAGDLSLEEVPEELITEIREEVSARLSDEDCTIIVLAELKQAIIISGDQPLVKTFRKRGKKAHGILWLLDQNEASGSYAPQELHACLLAIMGVNEWLPIEECQARLKRWSQKT